MNPTNIDWKLSDGRKLTHTWNPLEGCPRNCSINGKPWCYARRIHERFNKTPFSVVRIHPERFNDPIKHKKPAVIFVGSMSDIEFWPTVSVQGVIDVCKRCPKHTFMFLSKSETSYLRPGLVWPSNTMQGLTVTEGGEHSMHMVYHLANDVPRPFLSIEPLLGEFTRLVPPEIERVIAGSMSGPGAVPVQQSWVDSIKANVPADKIHWKGGKANVQLRRMAGVA